MKTTLQIETLGLMRKWEAEPEEMATAVVLAWMDIALPNDALTWKNGDGVKGVPSVFNEIAKRFSAEFMKSALIIPSVCATEWKEMIKQVITTDNKWTDKKTKSKKVLKKKTWTKTAASKTATTATKDLQ